MNKKNNRKGFTIVELVIVIAVIAILATVLVPTFGNVIDKAQASAALQEAKSIHTNYVASIDYTDADAVLVKDFYIIIDGEFYVQVSNGSIVGNATKTAPTVSYKKLVVDNTTAVPTYSFGDVTP